MDSLLKSCVDHGVEAKRFLKLCTRGNWLASHNYREHMAKEGAIIDAVNKSCHYWHQKELNEQRQEQASDNGTEVCAKPGTQSSA